MENHCFFLGGGVADGENCRSANVLGDNAPLLSEQTNEHPKEVKCRGRGGEFDHATGTPTGRKITMIALYDPSGNGTRRLFISARLLYIAIVNMRRIPGTRTVGWY